ncbi:TPA: hypothetical protein ACK3PA_002735 [Burkholderia cenocepacia]
MESIRKVSVEQLEKAFAEAVEKLTGKSAVVRIGSLVFASDFSSSAKLELVVTPDWVNDPDSPF